MDRILFLASGSQARKSLLESVDIPFEVIYQNADEAKCDWGLPLQQVVEQIATYKMDHLLLPSGQQNKEIFVLTADTITQDARGNLHGKPINQQDEIEKLRMLHEGVVVGTGFCLEKKVFLNSVWNTQDRIIGYAQARCVFDIPKQWMNRYIERGHGQGASGGMRIEGFGSLFLKSIEGSYTAVMGLPLYELRMALEKLKFWVS